MVVVKIELWPHGNESEARQIGEARISLDSQSHDPNQNSADYQVELRHAGHYWGKPGNWKSGRLKNHHRDLSPYHLVMRAIAACLGDR